MSRVLKPKSLAPRRPEPYGPLHHVLLQVLPLVSGEVYQVPEPQRIHHGEPIAGAGPAPGPRPAPPGPGERSLVTLTFPSHPDRHLREEFLCLSQRRLHAAHAEHCQVGLPHPWSPAACGLRGALCSEGLHPVGTMSICLCHGK